MPEPMTVHTGSVRRREDPPLMTGKGQYVGDIRRPGMLFVSFLRSPYPHARIVSIDVSKAEAYPGVVKVLTAGEIGHLGGLLTGLGPGSSWDPQPCLAGEKVNFAGEPIAAVVAESEAIAADAVDLIWIDYEVLPSVAGIDSALQANAPALFNEQGNIASLQEAESGNVEAGFAQADAIVSLHMEQPRLALVPMEARAILAEGHPDGSLSVWISHQSLWLARLQLALILRMPPDNIKLIVPNVGGAFGGKTRICGEEAITAFLAHTLQRPVRWLESRSENIVSMGHGRGVNATMEAAVKRDGTILAINAEFMADAGGYPGDFSLLSVGSTASMITGCYAIPAVKTTIKGVKTNAAPTGAYRGAGRPEACYFIERTIEVIARELGLDSIEVRKRNFIPSDAFPYTTATGTIYDSGAYAKVLDRLLEQVNYQELRTQQAHLRQQGQYIGIGLCVYVESTGLGGEGMTGRPDTVQVRIAPDGQIIVETASLDSGQGHATTFAQIVANELAVPVEQVEVQIGDSPNAHALGTFGSRSTVVNGSAVKLSAQDLKAKVLALAAHLLEAAETDLELVAGRVQVSGAPSKSYALAQLATIAEDPVQKQQYPENLQNELLKGLCSMRGFEPANMAFPFGAHLAMVQIDPETGEVKVLRYAAVDDSGKAIVPMLMEGQLHGAIAQGIGQALYEQMVYDTGGHVLSSTLMDYAVPLADELPMFEITHSETPSPLNILGAKGAGESGCIGAPPTITNAVLDALTPLGITTLDMPLTSEKIWQALHQL